MADKVTFYVAQDNGNLKFVDEVEGTTDPGEALDALLEARPRLNHDAYAALIGDLQDGVMVTLTREEVVEVKWVPTSLAAKAAAAEAAEEEAEDEEDDEEDEEPEPAPKRTRKAPTRKTASKPKTPAKKAPAKKPAGKKPAAGKTRGKSPFTRSAKCDD